MSDLISRQAAIDALGDEPEVWTGEDEYAQGLNNQWHYDRNAINAVPSAEPNKEQQKAGEWEMFELITSVYYGKQYYFKQENGVVYSRASHKYMPVDDAIQEFLDVIGE